MLFHLRRSTGDLSIRHSLRTTTVIDVGGAQNRAQFTARIIRPATVRLPISCAQSKLSGRIGDAVSFVTAHAQTACRLLGTQDPFKSTTNTLREKISQNAVSGPDWRVCPMSERDRIPIRTTALRTSSVTGPTGLYADLNSGHVPTYSYIVPNQCHDQHGCGNAGPKAQSLHRR